MIWKKRWFERLAPVGLGLITLVFISINRTGIAENFGPNGWQPGNLYNAVFNWASIQSGFVFGIYAFIATKQDGFMGELAGGRSLPELLKYARRAYIIGFALTFASLPMMVVAPAISDARSASFWVVAVWFSCFIWTFCAFLRVAFTFGLMAAVPDRPHRIPG